MEFNVNKLKNNTYNSNYNINNNDEDNNSNNINKYTNDKDSNMDYNYTNNNNNNNLISNEASYLIEKIVKNSSDNYRRKTYLSKDQLNLVKEAFDLFDIDNKGSIDLYELNLTLKALKFKTCKEEVKDLCTKYEIENNRIKFDDYIEILTLKFNQRNPKDEALLAFNLFDTEKTGKIGLKQLRKCVKELDEKISDTDLKSIIEEFDGDNDGYITKEEFIKILDEYYFN